MKFFNNIKKKYVAGHFFTTKRAPFLNINSTFPMKIKHANNTNIYRKANFIKPSEIIEIKNIIKRLDLNEYTSCLEDDLNREGVPVHTTTYLNTNNAFNICLPLLKQRAFELITEANKKEKWGFNLKCNNIHIRVAECHEYEEGSQLSNIKHVDVGSLVTVDIMLDEAEEGGYFQTMNNSNEITRHDFKPGDAIVFVSHKYHHITPVLRGSRKVIVIEYWNGVNRTCGHRCDLRYGPCTFADMDD